MIVVVLAGMVASGSTAYAAPSPVGLGTAESFSVLAGSAVTNTGPTVISGDLGLSPGTAVTGFPPGLVNGTENVTNPVALQAQNDLTTAYDDAASRTPVTDVGDLGGRTLTNGIYGSATTLSLTGTVTLDAQGDPDAVFVFKAGSTLDTASSSTVALTNGASPCNVFWQVGSSATLGTNSRFVGSILALTSATLNTGASVEGRVLARNGAVTLDRNVITAPDCDSVTSTPTGTATPSPTAIPTGNTPTDTSTGVVVPGGNPDTGMGGTSSPHPFTVLFGGLAAGGAAMASAMAIRRPRKARHQS